MYDEAAVGIFAALAGVFIVFGIVGIVGYVLMAIGLQRMAINEGIENAWLAWVPVGNVWIIGKLVKTIELGSNKWEQAELILVVAVAASILLSAIPVIGTIISLAVGILLILVNYKLYKLYAPEKAVMYLIVTIIFNLIAMGIILFILRDKKQVVEIIEE